jgi:L,D-transpeptidase ErfK/SrfK
MVIRYPILKSLGLLWSIGLFIWSGILLDYQPLSILPAYGFQAQEDGRLYPDNVIGLPLEYIVEKGDTLLDIARAYSFGVEEVQAINPGIDPWIPPVGQKVLLPSQWILPVCRYQGIVINIPEMRLYYFFNTHLNNHSLPLVKSFSIGIGEEAWQTPVGRYRVIKKERNPTWYIPESIWKEGRYPNRIVPPGPDNPLGKYRLVLSLPGYGIHGTDWPWAVGRLFTHGCIRLYPEDIEKLYNMVSLGTPVELVYQPIKVGTKGTEIYIEVHPDIYDKLENPFQTAIDLLKERGLLNRVDLSLVDKALEEQNGLPLEISKDLREEAN